MDQGKDPQIELALLKFCILMPKFNFALRSTPPQHIPHSIREFDALVSDTWLRRFGISMSPAQATQSALPAPSGLGLYRAVDIAPSAFLANVLCCTDLVGALLGDARPPEGLAGFADAQALYEASLRPVYPPRREVPPPPAVPALLASLLARVRNSVFRSLEVQRALATKVHAANLVNLEARPDLSDRDRARLRALSRPSAGTGLTCPPIPALGFRFEPEEFLTLLRWWLGAPIFADGLICGENACP
ncbi:MAG: hypothetical protein GY928_12665, partial [Colwellia sp.]|nr:hypothetical protein [Colwellia sp.]